MTDIDTDLFLYLESIMFCNSFKQLYNVMHFLRMDVFIFFKYLGIYNLKN